MRGPTSPYGSLSSLWSASKAAYSSAIDAPYAYLVRRRGFPRGGEQAVRWGRVKGHARAGPSAGPGVRCRTRGWGAKCRPAGAGCRTPGWEAKCRPAVGLGVRCRPAVGAGAGRKAALFYLRPTKVSGSTCRPFLTTSKCTCGPVDRPVDPISAIESPRLTVWPTETSVRWQWA